ncbi:MAG: calcium/sodium antiporter [Brevinematales bacterium]|nr:calcium/sodium antiporter [Brevinematales bacterium]
MLSWFLMLVGFLFLIYGANMLVDGASSLAKKLDIPAIVIGLTIVAFGTSTPELVVNIFASFSKNSDIALGNIIGSNIFNILGILGLSAVVFPLTVKSNTTWIEIPLCILSAVIVFIVANDVLITKVGVSLIDRIDGIVLLFFFVIFLVYNVQLMKSGGFEEEVSVKEYSLLVAILFIFFGLGLLFIGGKMVVTYAVEVARSFGIPQRIIALTIVSIGTSLPELMTSVVAAFKKNTDIAIGNIVGSNIFNVFFILGLSAVIYPVSLQKGSNMDMGVNILASLLLFLFVFTGRGRKLERWEGGVFLVLYLLYVYLLIALRA